MDKQHPEQAGEEQTARFAQGLAGGPFFGGRYGGQKQRADKKSRADGARPDAGAGESGGQRRRRGRNNRDGGKRKQNAQGVTPQGGAGQTHGRPRNGKNDGPCGPGRV